jgi:hypothetical protein
VERELLATRELKEHKKDRVPEIGKNGSKVRNFDARGIRVSLDSTGFRVCVAP